MSESAFGEIVSPWDVEQGAIATLRTWMPTYLAELERQNGLPPRSLGRPPAPESYHGATKEAIAWAAEELPAVIVIVEPIGEPELNASTGYQQCYEVEVHCVVLGDDGAQQILPEDSARMQASYYAAASMLLIQQPSLGGVSERTKMVSTPKVECPDPEKRREQAGITVFHVWAKPLIQPVAGPVGPTPEGSPGYEGAPEAPFKEPPEVQPGQGSVNVVAEPN